MAMRVRDLIRALERLNPSMEIQMRWPMDNARGGYVRDVEELFVDRNAEPFGAVVLLGSDPVTGETDGGTKH